MNPKMKLSWFQEEVARALQQFYHDMKAGKRPKLVLETPPQHGKSLSAIDFVAWVAGQDPDIPAIYASFSDRLGVRANLRLQRSYDSANYQIVFPSTRINTSNAVTISGQYLRNREILEYVGRDGFFRNTTVLGSITGEGLGFGLIDDPLKGREAANSEAIRDKTWDWFTDDFFTRFSEDAGLLITCTRWHLDDPVGRLIKLFPDVRVLKYQAIAEKKEKHRNKGEPLFPEHKSLDFLLARKALMTEGSWQALYQQNPIIVGGGLFPIERFKIDEHPPVREDIKSSVRYWDKAGTEGGGAYTAGVLMHQLHNGRFIVEDVVRRQLSALEREQMIKQTAQADGTKVVVWVEQEPGSGGLESAERTIANLAGFIAYKDRVKGDKELRAEPYAAQVQAGNIRLVQGPWVRAFLGEHESFPKGKYKDQVDAAGGAFVKLTGIVPGAGIMEFYRREAVKVADQQKPNGKAHVVVGAIRLRVPNGTTTVYGMTGKMYQVPADGIIAVDPEDHKPLLSQGFVITE